jgi:ribosomal protein L7/L12
MKIECTTEEARDLFNLDRVEQLQEYLEIARSDRDNLEKEVYDLKQQLAKADTSKPDTLPLSQLMKAVAKYESNPNAFNAQELRNTIVAALPDQKILQIKLIRDFSDCSLKEAKDFLEGTSNHIPSPGDNIPF